MNAWQRHVHREAAWGTVITFDLRAPHIDDTRAAAACRRAAQELHRIDAWLSPYRSDSQLSRLRNRTLTEDDVSLEVLEVISNCQQLMALTNGNFDPWSARGGFDPCGYVKGWGADRAAAILMDHGFANVSVNAAGDVTCRGQSDDTIDGWRIGIVDPRDRDCIIDTVVVKNSHVATSGISEQRDHIIDPATKQPAHEARSNGTHAASVLHPDGGTADALATALFIAGPAGLARIAELGAQALLITQDQAWTVGTAFSLGRQPTSIPA